MTTKQQLLDLAERVEREEPSRELDADIWLSVNRSYIHGASGRTCDVDETRPQPGRLVLPDAYTTSLDAAGTLVGNNPWAIRYIDGAAIAWVRGEPSNTQNPAAALTAAALRARAMEARDE
jgi:hypothetical protein